MDITTDPKAVEVINVYLNATDSNERDHYFEMVSMLRRLREQAKVELKANA